MSYHCVFALRSKVGVCLFCAVALIALFSVHGVYAQNFVPDLFLQKSANVSSAKPGDTIVYTLNYGNSGLADATGVVIAETIPANTQYAAGSSTPGWVCTPDINANSTCTFSVGPVASGSLFNSVDFAVKVITT